MKQPKPIPIDRPAKPESGRIAWTAEPKTSAFTGNVKVEEKERARVAIEVEIVRDGFDPSDCDIRWTMFEAGWGWVARLKEEALP